MTVWQDALSIVSGREACVLVTILQTAGSSPREAGAQMVVTAVGQSGSIGGGNFEYVVTQQARALLTSADLFRVQIYPLGPLLAQCCGGRVRILLERLDDSHRAVLDEICAAQTEGRCLSLKTAMENGRLRHSLIEERRKNGVILHDRDGRLVNIQEPLDKGFVFEQALPPANPLLLLFGAGHVGQAVARIATTLPLTTHWLDERAEISRLPFTGLAVDHGDWEAAVEAAPPRALYLIVSHSHTLDYALVRAVLRREDFLYCGLIGSKTKRARFEKRLLADGIASEVLERLKCPVGTIGLTSKLPAIIAVAVMAEMLLEIQNTPATGGEMAEDKSLKLLRFDDYC